MKKKKVEQVNLFEQPVKVKDELKPVLVKDTTSLKEPLQDIVRNLSVNHYFQESDKEGICRLCGKHGRNEIHGRKRK